MFLCFVQKKDILPDIFMSCFYKTLSLTMLCKEQKEARCLEAIKAKL